METKRSFSLLVGIFVLVIVRYLLFRSSKWLPENG
jgi:hypothetical protein